MLVDTTDNTITLTEPRSFAGLMTLYESNYIHLKQLLGPLQTLPDHCQSKLPGEPLLTVDVQTRARYTTHIMMTYWFAPDTSASVADPALEIKLYHDAHMAEVMACHNGGRHELLRRFRHRGDSEVKPRWTVNMTLHKWLEYCLDQRHFQPLRYGNSD